MDSPQLVKFECKIKFFQESTQFWFVIQCYLCKCFFTVNFFFLSVLVPCPAKEGHQTSSQVVDGPEVKTRLFGCFRFGTFSAASRCRRACLELFWWPWPRSATAAGGTALGRSSLLRRAFDLWKGFDDADDGDALEDNTYSDLRDNLEPTGICSPNVLYVIQRTSLAYLTWIVFMDSRFFMWRVTNADNSMMRQADPNGYDGLKQTYT